MNKKESTDFSLFVKTSFNDKVEWNRMRIVSSLLAEPGMSRERAENISKEVEKAVLSLGGTLTTKLIREIINIKLEEQGMGENIHSRFALSITLENIENLIFYPNRRKATQHHGPEGTNLLIAESAKAEYALKKVFSPPVAQAHLRGDIHLHQLGYIDRPSNSYNSIEYIKQFGLSSPGFNCHAAPAEHAEVLIAHLVRFSILLQGHYSGSIAWHALNVLIAPFLTGKTITEIKQLAQNLIFELSQMASPKGAQSVHCELHVYPQVPDYLANVRAIGPGGKEMEQCYGEFDNECTLFFNALIAVLQKGDGQKYPFFLPKFYVHLDEKAVNNTDILISTCETALSRGSIYFIFERQGELYIPGIGSVVPELLEDYERRNLRRSSIQTVSINLPALAMKKGNLERELDSILELALKAHMEKRIFLEKLMAQGNNGPLSFFGIDHDDRAYLDYSKTSHIIGIIGLDEMARVQKGKDLNSENGFKFAIEILEKICNKTNQLKNLYHLNIQLCQSPAESTAHRLGRLDLHRFAPEAAEFIKGDIGKGEIYYHAPGFIDSSIDIDPLKRAEMEGILGSYIHLPHPVNIYVKSCCPPASELADFLEDIFMTTQCKQLSFSPMFTKCLSCLHLSRGDLNTCEKCNSFLVDKVVRVTDYYASLSNCNKGKTGEVLNRFMNDKYF